MSENVVKWEDLDADEQRVMGIAKDYDYVLSDDEVDGGWIAPKCNPEVATRLREYGLLLYLGKVSPYNYRYTLTPAGRALIPTPDVTVVGCTRCHVNAATDGGLCATCAGADELATLRAERDALRKIYDITASCDVFGGLLDSLKDEDAVLWAQLDAAISEAVRFAELETKGER